MKKFTVLALAALLVVAFAMPASALENIFGGYWQTRMAAQKNFDGDNTGALDIRQVDTRTRIYYTAKINDKLKLVNKFEMDTQWGNSQVTAAPANTMAANWGDAGADGVAIEIKQSYADFNIGPVNFLLGAHWYELARGFISKDDASGLHATWKINDGLYAAFAWNKNKEGGASRDANEQDIDMYVLTPIIMLSKDIKIQPYYVFLHAEDGGLMTTLGPVTDNINASIFGLDFDAKMGPVSVFFTGIMQTGTITTSAGVPALNTGGAFGPKAAAYSKGTLVQGDTIDLSAYLLAAGGKFDLGKADIHAQGFYATGEDTSVYTDKEINGYFTTSATDYHWAEILGGGIFDNMTGGFSNNNVGSPGQYVSNVMALNIGTTIKPMDKLTVTADLWYAKLAEERLHLATATTPLRKVDELGFEADLMITYKLIDGLNIDIVGAYLWAGDAVSADGKNDKNPYEFGTRLSLSF